MTLTIWGNSKEEFALEDEQAKMIVDLFYNHEKETHDSLAASVATLQFRIGEDIFSTSLGELEAIEGRINGELVSMELSKSEYETLYQIVSQYASDDTP